MKEKIVAGRSVLIMEEVQKEGQSIPGID